MGKKVCSRCEKEYEDYVSFHRIGNDEICYKCYVKEPKESRELESSKDAFIKRVNNTEWETELNKGEKLICEFGVGERFIIFWGRIKQQSGTDLVCKYSRMSVGWRFLRRPRWSAEFKRYSFDCLERERNLTFGLHGFIIK